MPSELQSKLASVMRPDTAVGRKKAGRVSTCSGQKACQQTQLTVEDSFELIREERVKEEMSVSASRIQEISLVPTARVRRRTGRKS